MILAWFLWGSVLLRGELRKYAKKSNFVNFESALYSTSVSMPLRTVRVKKGDYLRRVGSGIRLTPALEWMRGSTDDSPHLQTRPKYTNLPHVKVATIQTCPKYKLAPLYCVWQDTVRVGCIWSSIECVSGSAGNGLGQQTVWSIDRCYVYSVMSIRNRAILISYCWTLFYNLTCYHTRSIKLIREIAYTSWSNR